jgi:hypothetical protein
VDIPAARAAIDAIIEQALIAKAALVDSSDVVFVPAGGDLQAALD